MAEASTAEPKGRHRSPGYPTIPLEEAIAKANVFRLADKGAAATPEVLAHHWKSSTKSSAFLQWLPSLKRYGLLDEVRGPTRQLKLTKLALDILMLPEGEPPRQIAVKAAALLPAAFREFWGQYGAALPSDQNLIHALVTTKNFRPDAATDLIRQYKRTIAFAKLGEGDKIVEVGSGVTPDTNEDLSIGDFVQWESQGTMQFPEPRRLIGFSDDQVWAFVEGSATGVLVGELKKVDAPAKKPNAMNTPGSMTPPPTPPHMKGLTPPPPPASGQKDFALHITNNQSGGLHVPAKMTAKDYELLKKQIENHLMVIEATCVEDDPKN